VSAAPTNPSTLRRRLALALVCIASVLAACDDRSRASPDDAGDTNVADIGDGTDDGVTDTAASDGDSSGGDDASDTVEPDFGQPDPPLTLTAGMTTLTVDPATRTLALDRPDSPGQDDLLVFDASAFELAIVDEIADDQAYSPWGFKVDSILNPRPPIRGWAELLWIDVVDTMPSAAELALVFEDGHTASLTLEVDADNRFRAELTPAAPGPEAGVTAFIRLRPRVDTTEAFYGLGELFDSVEHRGRVRAMQLEVAGLESGNNEAHVPVPLLIGTRGWGLFVASREAGVFDVAAVADDRVDAIFAQTTEPSLSLWLFAEDHPLDVTRHYYDVTGYPAIPARWALGPWIWRDENEDQAQVESDVATIRDLDLATTAYWIDRPYASAVNTFDFASEMFTDPAAMVATVHDLGFRLALWHTPYVDEEDPAAAGLYQDAVDGGFFPPETGLLFNNWSRPLDFTNDAARDWWQANLQTYADLGVEGYKLDYAEDVVIGALGARNAWRFADGSTERTMHASYQLFYHEAYAEMLPESGGFLLCRGGTWGDQTNASVIWPGDLDASFARHGETVTDDNGETYEAVGGLPAALIAGLSLGPSGFPLFGSDTGGYRHSPPDKETFTRWFQITALSPVMQVGTSTNDVPWEFDADNGFDQEMLDWYRRYARLHLRLWPYVWTHLRNVQRDGRPIQRALGLAFPELGVHPDDVFLLGDDILVAPVVERGARTRTFAVPPGEWIDWWTDAVIAGDGEHTADAPLSTLPLYQRAGSLVPMLRPTIDAIAPTGQPDRVDSLDTDTGLLWVRVAPGPTASFSLYDSTELEQSEDDVALDIGIRPGDEFVQGAVFEIVSLDGPPASVSMDGSPLPEVADSAELEGTDRGWHMDPASGRLYARVPSGAHELVVTK